MTKRPNWLDILLGGAAIVGTGMIVKQICDNIYRSGYNDGYSKGYNQGYWVAKTENERQIAELRAETETALKMVENKFEKRMQELDESIRIKVKKILEETVNEALRKQPVIRATKPAYNV